MPSYCATMAGRERETNFSRWLRATLTEQNKSVRGLSREIAATYKGGATVSNTETVRRALNKYLGEGRLPSGPMRAAIAEALGVPVTELPEDDDEEEADLMALILCEVRAMRYALEARAA